MLVFQEFFHEEANSIIKEISIVMLIFLLFSDKILGGESLREGKLLQEALPAPPPPRGRNQDVTHEDTGNQAWHVKLSARKNSREKFVKYSRS